MTENWHAWYLGGADSKSWLRFLKFRPQNPFLVKFEPKKSKLSVFPENWRTWCLDNADSYSNISFRISNPKSMFGQIWAKKVKVVRFAWKLAHKVSPGCWSLFQHKFSEFQNLNQFLSKFGSKKSKLSILAKNWHREYLEDTDVVAYRVRVCLCLRPSTLKASSVWIRWDRSTIFSWRR